LTGVGDIARAVWAECVSTWRRPDRIWKIGEAQSWRRLLRFQGIRLKAGRRWDTSGSPRLSARRLASYEDYLSLQRSKLEYLDLSEHEQAFRRVLRERVGDLGFVRPGVTVLCLGARLGSEVAAFIDCGTFAVGVDLNPGTANPYVVTGDFHALQFADRSVDVVYSNSVDHAFDLKRLLAEVRRVLKPEGHLVLELDPGTHERAEPADDLWQTLAWNATDDLVNAVRTEGFFVVGRRKYDYPRGGTQVVLRPESTALDRNG